MITRYADLHVHTFYSDSTFSPEEVVETAKNSGLAAIAICDHDSVSGIAPCTELASKSGLEIIPSIELTVEKPDAEMHLLGYFIDWKADWFLDKLKKLRSMRLDRMRKMVELLHKFEIHIDPEEVFKLAGKGTVGRLHLAMAILKTGKINNLREAFEKYIGFMKPCYVPSSHFTPKEAMEAVLKLGGVPVLAHPVTVGKDDYIPELIEYGLRGIEVYHTDHKNNVRRHYEELAKRYGLLVTGGSDCHGLGKGRVLLGTVKVPYELVELLKAESEKVKSENRTR